jgi:hypoxanthine phosphoribosyltransferase
VTDTLAGAAWAVYRDAQCLHDAAAVQAAIRRLGGEITAALAGADPVVLCPMTGAVVFAGQLLPHLAFPLTLDYLHATRYQGALEGGALAWRARPATPLAGRHVLVVDDVLDRGVTLAAILAWCREQGAAGVRSAVLVEKDCPREAAVQADHVALHAPNRYLFGCGMDWRGYLRNAPGIYAVREG